MSHHNISDSGLQGQTKCGKGKPRSFSTTDPVPWNFPPGLTSHLTSPWHISLAVRTLNQTVECWYLNFSSRSSCLDACVIGTIVVNQLPDVIKLLFKYPSSGVPRIRSALDAGSFCINIMKYHGYGIQVQTEFMSVLWYHTYGLKLILHNVYNVFLLKIFCGGDFSTCVICQSLWSFGF